MLGIIILYPVQIIQPNSIARLFYISSVSAISFFRKKMKEAFQSHIKRASVHINSLSILFRITIPQTYWKERKRCLGIVFKKQ